MKRKSGWYKKAKLKFVQERVFDWTIRTKENGFRITKKIGAGWSANIYWVTDYEKYKDEIFGWGGIEGFWKARRLSKLKPDKWTFYFEKRELLLNEANQ